MIRLIVASLVLVVAHPALADRKSDAHRHVELARTAHAAGKYQEALTELTRAYQLDPSPALLYAIGQVHVKLGDCASAVMFYKQFLATHPPARDTRVVEQAIATCEAVQPAKPVDQPAKPVDEPAKPGEEPVKQPKSVEAPPKPVEAPPKPVDAPPAPAEAPPKPDAIAPPPPARAQPPQQAGWYTDWLGDVLVGGGLVAGALGVLEYRAALADRDSAALATTDRGYGALVDSAQRERDIALGLAVGGAVLVTAGVAHYLLHDRGPAEHAAVEVTANHVLVLYAGHL